MVSQKFRAQQYRGREQTVDLVGTNSKNLTARGGREAAASFGAATFAFAAGTGKQARGRWSFFLRFDPEARVQAAARDLQKEQQQH